MKNRAVKCFATGEHGTTDTFYKAPNGRYFKSKEVYDDWFSKRKTNRRRKEGRTGESYHRICSKLADHMGYKPGQPFPTIIGKRLKELDFYSDEVIEKTIDECGDSIDYAFRTKQFRDDFVKASYMMSIIRNNIADVYKKHESQTKHRQEIKNDSAMQPDCISSESLLLIGKKESGVDLRNLIGDDLWT